MRLDKNFSVSLSLVALLIITIFVSPIPLSPWHLRTVSADEFSNSTQHITNSTLTNSTLQLTKSISTNPVNYTSSYQSSINNENSISNVTNSLNLDSLPNSSIQGNVNVKKNSNGTSFSMIGSGYVKESIDSTRELS